MPLPSTALTFHANASDNDHVWKKAESSSPFHSGVPVDGDIIEIWQDDDGKDLVIYPITSGVRPTWRSATPLMRLPCLDWDGTDDQAGLYSQDLTSGNLPLSTVISANAFVVIASFYVEDVIGTFTGLFCETGGLWSLYVVKNAGIYSVAGYTFDGASKVVSIDLNLNTSYVVVYCHTGSDTTLELFSSSGKVGSTPTLATGSITSLASDFRVARNFNGTEIFNGRIGECAFYNAYNVTDRANAIQYFRDKWVPGATEILLAQAML